MILIVFYANIILLQCYKNKCVYHQVPIRMFIHLRKSFSNCLHKSNMKKIKRLALLFGLVVIRYDAKWTQLYFQQLRDHIQYIINEECIHVATWIFMDGLPCANYYRDSLFICEMFIRFIFLCCPCAHKLYG